MNLINIFNSDQTSRDVFARQGIISSDVHPILAKSWLRSLKYNINPDLHSTDSISNLYLNELEQLLLDVVKPYIKYFSTILNITETILAISNENGVIIYTEYFSNSNKIIKAAEKHNFLVGANWSEQRIGTNAIGTAIEEKTNLLVYGAEHYSYSLQPYSCAASPIFNQKDGKIIGVLDITKFGKMHPHTLGLITAIADLVEKEINKIIGNNNKSNNLDFKISPIPQITFKCNNGNSFQLIGENTLFQSSLKDSEKVAKTQLNVFLSGETGTGKEVFAKYIHSKSNRSQGPFIAVNCAAIPKDLVASELFGYVGGAFTGADRQGRSGRFEQANGGTLFLDEIADAPHEVQVGLLRILEEKKLYRLGSERGIPLDVRVLSASSQELDRLIHEKLFREDLYYRLAGLVIDIPALRHREQDIILLAEHFLNNYRDSLGYPLKLENDLKQVMLDYKWPGNIRELRNIIDRMVVLSETKELTKELFLKCLPRKVEIFKINENPEKQLLLDAIKKANGNITRAAKILSIDRTTVYRRIKKFGLESSIYN